MLRSRGSGKKKKLEYHHFWRAGLNKERERKKTTCRELEKTLKVGATYGMRFLLLRLFPFSEKNPLLTEYFPILEPAQRPIGALLLVQKHRSTDFEAVEL